MLLQRLEAWREEMRTNKHGMKDLAPKAINAIKAEIHRLKDSK